MLRGRFIIVAMPGDCGKPRPALIVQNDFYAALPSVVVCPLTSTLRGDAEQFRILVKPTPQNGLREVSQIAVDKIGTMPRSKIGQIIGSADDELMCRVNRMLAVFLGIV